MPQLGSSGIQALVSSFTEKDVDQALKEIAKKIARSVDDVNDQLNKISIDKNVIDNIVNQLKALPEEVRKKAQGMSFDLFSDLINANGAEEKIDEAFKTFTNKIQSFVKLRDQIGNDEIIIKADYSQIDELIRKTGRLLELQKELDKWQKGTSPKTKVNIEGDISNLESEIKSGISNLNIGTTIDSDSIEKEKDKAVKSIKELEREMKGIMENLNMSEPYPKNDNQLKKLQDFIVLFKQYKKEILSSGGQINSELEADFNWLMANKDLKNFANGWDSSRESLDKYNVSQEEALRLAKELSKKRSVATNQINKDNIEDIKDMVGYMQRYIGLSDDSEAAIKKLNTEVGRSNVRRLTGESGDIGYSEHIDEIQNVRKEVGKLKQEINETGNINIDSSVSNEQNKLQSELNKTKEKLQEVGNEAQEAKQKIEDLGKVDVNQEVNPKKTPAPSPSPKEEPQQSPSIDSSDTQTYKNLQDAIAAVEQAIKSKTEAIQDEEVQMYASVNGEIKKLEELKNKLNEIKTEFEQGIASGLFKDANKDTNNEETDGTSVNVDLKPTVDANKFKEDAERLLTFIDVEKEVNLKVGELDRKQIDNGNNINTSSISETLGKNFDTSGKKEATAQLREAYKEFQQFYNNQEILATQEGQEAAYKYYMSYKEALNKNVADKTLNTYSFTDNKYDNSEIDNLVNETKNNLESLLKNSFSIKLQPLLIQSEWEAEIDKILKAIGTKKIKIEPDISSEAWNSFKTFVDNISKQVINLKVVDKGSYGIPSDLKASYTNSTKYVTELYKVEEKIAQAKESGNQKDLERLATLEAEKKKYEDLLRLEEQFRANEKFKDFDTTSQDNALNKLKSTKEQEYQSNRQVAAIRIEEEAYNENQKFDENKKLEKASSLLEQQKAKWEEIQNIRIKISNLDPVNDADEINNLNAQKSSLESELSMIEKELTLYDSLIDKKKQSNELDKIAANADKQVNDNTLDRVNKLYNDYVNNISEQAQLELKGGNRTDEEEQRLVQLRQEYLDLIERINKALTEEQNKTSAISKILESMKIAKDLGVSGVLRNNDVDQGYEEANKVNNALNEAEKKMEDLEKLGQTDLFKQAFSDANNEINNLNQQLISGEITLIEYNKKVKEITTSLSKKTNAVAFFDPGDMEKTAQQMKDLAQQLPGLREDTIKWGAGNKSLTAIFQDQNGEWKKLTLNAQTAEKVITATFTNAQKPATTFSKFIDELGAKFRNLGSYLLSFVGFYEIWGQIKQGVTYVKELDTALTEMRKVSDETVESLREFQEVSFATADAIGTTAKEIQNSTADFMRLGYTLQEAGELAEDANIYANVGDMDIDEATEHMISSIKAWGSEFENEVEASEAIIDRYNEIGM